MDLTSQLVQYLFSGIIVGAIYGLIALGFVIIYSVNGQINFTQGEFVMLGSLITAGMVKGGSSLWLAILVSLISVSIIAAVFQRVVLYTVRDSSVVTVIIITIGAAVAMRGIALLIWGTQSYPLPPFSSGDPIWLAGAVVERQGLWVLFLSVLAVSFLFFFFERTSYGMALRACAVNRLAAGLMGISYQRMSLLAFTLSGVLCGLAGIVMSPITTASYDMGLMLGLKGFVAAVLGGLTSTRGAVLGGILLGVLESMGAGLISSGYKDAIAFFVLLLVLLKRPNGLFGQIDGKRV